MTGMAHLSVTEREREREAGGWWASCLACLARGDALWPRKERAREGEVGRLDRPEREGERFEPFSFSFCK